MFVFVCSRTRMARQCTYESSAFTSSPPLYAICRQYLLNRDWVQRIRGTTSEAPLHQGTRAQWGSTARPFRLICLIRSLWYCLVTFTCTVPQQARFGQGDTYHLANAAMSVIDFFSRPSRIPAGVALERSDVSNLESKISAYTSAM